MARRRGSSILLRLALTLVALAGCAVCGVLVVLSLPAGASDSGIGSRLCAATDTVDCSYVLGSRWARLGPIPVSVLGAGYFGGLAAWFAVVGVPNLRGRPWHWVPTALTGLGLCGSCWLTFVMIVQLPVWCTWCLAVHAINLPLFVLTLYAWPRRTGAADDLASPSLPYPSPIRALSVLAGSSAVILIAALSFLFYSIQRIAWHQHAQYLEVTNNAEYITWRYRQAPVQEVPVRPDDLSLGPQDAAFTVVVFSDFECANCGLFFHYAGQLVDLFPGRLRCVFKHYPLCGRCNPYVPRASHVFSCEAALAAEAARSVGPDAQAFAFCRLLYERRLQFDERPYLEWAAEAGLDAAKVQSALSDESGRKRLEQDVESAHALGVEGTPALFLNGRRLPAWYIIPARETGSPASGTPPLDPQATVALWEKLLGNVETPKRQNAETDRLQTGPTWKRRNAETLMRFPEGATQGVTRGSPGRSGGWRPLRSALR